MNSNTDYLNLLSTKAIIDEPELEKSEVINKIITPDFKCLSVILKDRMEIDHVIIRNEHVYLYVVYNCITLTIKIK